MPEKETDMRCPECGEEAILTETHWVCPNDGLVIRPKFDDGLVVLEETAKTYGKRFAAVSNDPQYFVRMGTTVGWRNSETKTDARRGMLDLAIRKQYKTLQWHNYRVARGYSDERLGRWLELYNRACNVLALPLSLQKDGGTLLRKVYEKSEKYLRTSNIIAAIIYLTCRYRQYVLPLATIEEAFLQMGYPAMGKDIVKNAMYIRKITQLRVRPFGPNTYLNSLVERLRHSRQFDSFIQKYILPQKQQEYWVILRAAARQVIARVSEKALSNRHPRVLAAAAIIGGDVFLLRYNESKNKKIYVESRKRGVLTQTAVARILDIREYTLREHYLVVVRPALRELMQENLDPLW